MKPKNIVALAVAALLLSPGSTAFADPVTEEVIDEMTDAVNEQIRDEMTDETGLVVNVNEADATTIANVLKNIGVLKAQAIVDYREQHGRFYSAEELSAIKGIGEKTIAKNAHRIITQ